MPPPAATAAFSSPPQPGRRLAGVEDAWRRSGDRLDVAGGQRRDPGEVAEEVERGPLGGEQRAGRAAGQQHLGGHLLAPLALDDEALDLLDPALAHRLGHQLEPEDDSRALSARSAPAPAVLGHGRLGGHVAAAEVLGQRPRDQLRDVPRPVIADILRHPSGRAAGGSHVSPPARLIHRVTALPPFQTAARRARRRRDGGLAGRGRPRRRRGLLPGDLPGRPARLPELRRRRATCAAGC